MARRSSRAPRGNLRRRLFLSVVLASLALSASASAAYADCPAGDFAPTSPRALVRAVFCEIDSMRATHGLRVLRRNRRLSQAASRHARDMLRRRYFSHRSPNGTTALTRARRSGYGTDAGELHVGETLGLGFAGTAWALTPRRLVWKWLASPSHRRVLVSRRYRDLGIGAVFFRWGATQAFVVAADFGWQRARKTPQ